MEPDFSGFATKANLECADGLTIMPDAFKHMDGVQVPLLYQHGHNDIENVLGHAILRAVDGDVRVDCFFNSTPKAQIAKEAVQHKDINAMSIFANRLVKRGAQVFHGMIREVSLVLAGANPGAKIDFVRIAHSVDEYDPSDPDTYALSEDEAVIHTGLQIEVEAQPKSAEETVEHAEAEKQRLLDIYNNMSDTEKEVVHFMVGEAAGSSADSSAEHSDTEESEATENDDAEVEHDAGDTEDESLTHQEGTEMTRNVFEQNGTAAVEGQEKLTLAHSEIHSIMERADSCGSLKQALGEYAVAHGITNLELLFPEAQTIGTTPEFDKRRTEWVSGVLNGVRSTPFARVKTQSADLKQDQARALGYIKGNLKKEEWFSLTQRETTPTTVYKKQKLDRDDIIDITSFDVVVWMKGEMRLMLEEELARAILIGDGRPVEDPANPGNPNPDKIKDPAGAASGPGIRSILNDDDLYAATVNVNVDDASSSQQEVVDAILLNRHLWKGTGTPTFYTTNQQLVKMLLTKDTLGRRLWRNKEELASELMVDRIVEVEVMETVPDLIGIIVNLSDYNVGTDKGGEVTMFDDFDIDFNQYKYLIETRLSGALVKLRSALVIKKVAAASVLVDPITAPTMDEGTYVVTIPTQTGVVYKNGETNATLTAGAQAALANGATLYVVAVPATGYFFENNVEDEWIFTNPV